VRSLIQAGSEISMRIRKLRVLGIPAGFAGMECAALFTV
jgi:hypothetical protein